MGDAWRKVICAHHNGKRSFLLARLDYFNHESARTIETMGQADTLIMMTKQAASAR
jgi:hypothetical protein